MGRHNYIAVEGPIGCGKSVLVDALARALGARKITTPVEENPFLDKFYREPQRYAFQTQIFFLLTRHSLMLQLFELDLFHESVVVDFVFERDKLFASLILEPQEFKLYSQIEEHLNKDLPCPQLVVYLQAPTDFLVREIAVHGREFERKYLTEGFLAELVRAYNEFFFNWSRTPLLVVDRTTVDLNNPAQLEALVEYVANTPIRGHQYYSESLLL